MLPILFLALAVCEILSLSTFFSMRWLKSMSPAIDEWIDKALISSYLLMHWLVITKGSSLDFDRISKSMKAYF